MCLRGNKRKKQVGFCVPSSQIRCFSFSVSPSEDKATKAEVQQAPDGSQQAPDGSQQTADGTQLPSGHPSLASSQGTGSKCPFLAAEMSQGGSSVFRKASLALQEDVQEMHAVREGKLTGTLTRVKRPFGSSRPSDLSELLLGEFLCPHLPLLGPRRKVIQIGDCVVNVGVSLLFVLCRV